MNFSKDQLALIYKAVKVSRMNRRELLKAMGPFIKLVPEQTTYTIHEYWQYYAPGQKRIVTTVQSHRNGKALSCWMNVSWELAMAWVEERIKPWDIYVETYTQARVFICDGAEFLRQQEITRQFDREGDAYIINGHKVEWKGIPKFTTDKTKNIYFF